MSTDFIYPRGIIYVQLEITRQHKSWYNCSYQYLTLHIPQLIECGEASQCVTNDSLNYCIVFHTYNDIHIYINTNWSVHWASFASPFFKFVKVTGTVIFTILCLYYLYSFVINQLGNWPLSKITIKHTVIYTMTSSNGNISALLALCEGNSPVTGEVPSQRPVTRSFDVFFDLCLNQQLSKQWRRRWFETPSRSSHHDVTVMYILFSLHQFETPSRSSRRHCNIYLIQSPSVIYLL